LALSHCTFLLSSSVLSLDFTGELNWPNANR
jgi:hypothetical protein